MKVLLTGSSGWLGRHLAPMLQGQGHAVIGLDIAPGEFTDVVGSVADPTILDHIFSRDPIDAVVHAGALHKPDIARYSSQAFVDVNVTGTLYLLERASAAGADRFIFTSTTSLMISETIREEAGDAAVWLDEESGPLMPRNIYGVTKLAAEGLCRMYHLERGLSCVILRTGRFFPEEDDSDRDLSGHNQKANELLYRRLTVEDAARAHLAALDRAPELGFDLCIVSAPTPFSRSDAGQLKRDAPSVIERYFPGASALYAARGWRLPASIGRVYDSRRAQTVLGCDFRTDFAQVLDALRSGEALPFAHDANYISPQGRLTEAQVRGVEG